MCQTAQELSCEVPNLHVPVPQAPLGKPCVDKGLVSDKATWADVTEEEQKKMEESLGFLMSCPSPFLKNASTISCAKIVCTRQGRG
eukprot:12415696-Karenia_brevis.AAC.1